MDYGNVAEKVATKNKQGNPDNSTNHVVSKKFSVIHFSDAGHERRESADNGNKAGKDDCFSAVFFVKILRLLQIFFVYKFNFRADKMPQPVIDGVAQNRGQTQKNKQPKNF